MLPKLATNLPHLRHESGLIMASIMASQGILTFCRIPLVLNINMFWTHVGCGAR